VVKVLRSGDLITALDKEQIQGLTLQEAVEKMRGPVNSPITLTIVRKGVDDVGYIRVTTFNEQTSANGALRLTTARYYTPSGRSVQAKGIEPNVVVEEELPDDLKKKADELSTRGEANLRGHLKIEGVDAAEEASEEESGSSSYVAPERDKDTQLNYALDLLRGIKSVGTEIKKKAEAN
jgi:C-terminal processing protease CtpA/Prc